MPDPIQNPYQSPTNQTNSLNSSELLLPKYKGVTPGVTMPRGYNHNERESIVSEIQKMENFKTTVSEIVKKECGFKLDLIGIPKEDQSLRIPVSIIGERLKAAHGELEKKSDINLTFESIGELTNKQSEKKQNEYIKLSKSISGDSSEILKGLSTYSEHNQIIIRSPRDLASPKTENFENGANAGFISIRGGSLDLRPGINLETVRFYPVTINEIKLESEKNELSKEDQNIVKNKLAEISFQKNLSGVLNNELKQMTSNGYAVPTNSYINITFNDNTTKSYQMLSPNERITYHSFNITNDTNKSQIGTFESKVDFEYLSKAFPGELRQGTGLVIFNKEGLPLGFKLKFQEGREIEYTIPHEIKKK